MSIKVTESVSLRRKERLQWRIKLPHFHSRPRVMAGAMEQETETKTFLLDADAKGSLMDEGQVNGEDTASENSNTSSCGELTMSLRTQWNESASLSDSNCKPSDVQTQIKQKLRGLSPVKRRSDLNAQDNKRNKQRNRISQIISGGSFRTKRELFTKLFILNRGLPDDEQLITDISCAMQRDILVHGRLYLSQNWLCFYANIIGWETLVTINWADITAITKEKTARVIPNAIQVCTNSEKYFLTSFVSRENSYRSLFRIWQNALMGQPNTPQHLRGLCKRYRGSTGSRDETEHPTGNENDRDEADETGDEVTENDIGQDDDNSFTASEISQETGQDQVFMENKDVPLGSTSISVIPPSPTTSDTQPNDTFISSTERGNARPASPQPSTGSKDYDDKEEPVSPRPISPLFRRAENLINFARRRQRPKKKVNRSLKHLVSISLPVPDPDAEESTEMEEEGSISSEDDLDIECPCHDCHPGKQYIVEDYNFDIDALYEHLFSKDSDLMKRLHEERKMLDFSYGPIENLPEGGSCRTVKYTLSLNYSIGPKSSPTTLKQIFHKDNKPGSFYVIDAEVRNQGIPYSESFYVHNRYCLTRLFGNRSRMRICGQVVLTKNVMGFMKNMILRNADEALVDFCNHLGLFLRQESDLLPNEPRRKPSPVSGKDKLRKDNALKEAGSKTKFSRTKESGTSPIPEQEVIVTPTPLAVWITSRVPSFTSLLLIMLLCLLSMNTFLFYRLYKLETLARADGLCGQRPLPTSHEEWHQLIQHQKYAYGIEVKRLKSVIGNTAELVKQVERSISELYKELEESFASAEDQSANILRFRAKPYPSHTEV